MLITKTIANKINNADARSKPQHKELRTTLTIERIHKIAEVPIPEVFNKDYFMAHPRTVFTLTK